MLVVLMLSCMKTLLRSVEAMKSLLWLFEALQNTGTLVFAKCVLAVLGLIEHPGDGTLSSHFLHLARERSLRMAVYGDVSMGDSNIFPRLAQADALFILSAFYVLSIGIRR